VNKATGNLAYKAEEPEANKDHDGDDDQAVDFHRFYALKWAYRRGAGGILQVPFHVTTCGELSLLRDVEGVSNTYATSGGDG
jgi:hypothetical protein